MDDRIAIALKSEKISDMPINVLIGKVSDILSSVYMLTGFSAPNPKDLGLLTAKITSDLKRYHGGLSIQELAVCLENGSKDEYGEFMGINVRTITKWLKAYKTSDKRYKTILEIENNKQALPPPGKEYGEQQLKILAIRYFREYQVDKRIGNLVITVYQFLQKMKIINHTADVKIAAYDKAKASILRSKNSLSMPIDMFEFRAKLQAQTELLREFFEELEQMGIDLEDMFNQKQVSA